MATNQQSPVAIGRVVRWRWMLSRGECEGRVVGGHGDMVQVERINNRGNRVTDWVNVLCLRPTPEQPDESE